MMASLARISGGVFALLLLAGSTLRADDWPQWLGPKRDGVWREKGLIEKFPTGGPKVVWRQPIGMGYAGPAVADGKVFVTDRLLAKDAKIPLNAFDSKTVVNGSERVHCLKESNGETIWTHEYPCNYRVSYAAGPRCTPTVDGDRVYTLGTMGDLFCFNIADGKVLWSKNFVKDFGAQVPVWGFSAHPLIDGNKLICLAGGSGKRLVMAFNKMTGEVIWTGLSTTGDFGYCPPVIYQVGKTRQLIIWHNESVNGLDPETGKLYWTQPFEIKASLTAPMPRYENGRLLVTSFYNGSRMYELNEDKPEAKLIWRGKSNSERADNTDGLHSIMPTPIFHGDYIYGVCSYGQLRCLKSATGERVWESLVPTTGKLERWGNAFLVEQGERCWLFNERGELIIAKLTPDGYDEIDRAKIIEPTNKLLGPSRPVVWMHPAFANKAVYARNDQEIIKVSAAK